MEVNSDLRRSPRLQQNGYYNEDGRPCINYYEAPYRAPKRRGQRSATAPPAGRSFLTCHPFILLLCGLAMGCVFSMQVGTSFNFSSVMAEPLKMTRDEPVLSPKPDGLPNFPAKAQDAEILRGRSSETYARNGYVERALNWFCPKYQWVVQDNKRLVPGFCWPFAGSNGHLHFQLDKPVHISHVTIGHITKAQSPTGEITTGPKQFSVYGLETSGDETLLGRFEYDASGPAFQTFPVASAVQGAFKDVRLNVESNWAERFVAGAWLTPPGAADQPQRLSTTRPDNSIQIGSASLLMDLKALLSHETIATAPVLILGNKIDRPEAISEGALRGAFALDGQLTGKGNVCLKDLNNVRPLEIFMCSVLRRQGYGEGFTLLSQYID